MGEIYLKRIVDDILEKRLGMIGAIVIVGPKWCGKTTTGEQHSKSVLKLQDPDYLESYMELAEFKPSKLLEGEKPRLIDEWQNIPVIWDAVRTSVDNLHKDGQYILTGSTVIDEDEIMHSGTGRIHRLVMRPMSLYESKESNGKISILDLFENPDMDIDGIMADLTIEQLVYAACRGGWPESLNKKDIESQLFVASNYVDNICNVDVSGIDNVKRDPKKVKAILQSYSRNISTTVSNKTILSDIKGIFPTMAITTYNSYINALSRLFVIDDIPAWSPNIRSATAIRSKPKREFIDPSIAVASLNMNPDSLLFDLKTFGFIFENLCIRDLQIYSSPMNGEVSYYRDRHGLEADCVLHLKNGDYALIEFKLGRLGFDDAAKNLLKLDNLIKECIKTKNLNMKEPKFLAIVTGTNVAYTRKDGVKVLPIACLR
ncbi:MAG: DUF4143 domain-containing protein [Methanobacteriaceae archaeon]|nr:DUF4143 domain-containing protein [Methanobacteriaceae archaeon]